MADEPKPVETPVAAPVAEVAAVAPAAPIVASEAPIVAPEPVVAAPAAEPAPAADVPPPGLLEQFDADKTAKEAEAKPAEPAKDAKVDDKAPPKPEAKPEEKPAEAKKEGEPEKPAEPAKLEPVAYEYALPESLKMDDAVKASFHEALDGFRADPAKGAQKLIDLHNQTMATYAEQLQKDTLANQIKTFHQTRKSWQTRVMGDEQIGGAGYQTSMGAIARMRDMLVPESDRGDFNEFLKYTGAGDHPAFLRMLHNAARYFDEPAIPPPNPQPTKDNGRAPNRRGILYDNPRSPGNRQ